MSTSPVHPANGRPALDDRLAIREQIDPIPHLCLQGTLDTLNTPQFNAYVRGPIPKHRGWVLIDSAQLNMLTSSGAGALIELATTTSKAGGGLALVIPPGLVRDAIGFMRLDLVIDTFDSFDTAVAFIDAQTS